MMRLLVYQLGLNGVWCACVFGALWGLPWLGPTAAVPWLFWHVRQQASAADEGAIVLAAGAFGVVADLVLIRLGGLEYAGLPEGALVGPAWIVALWMVFATTVKVSLGWLRGRIWLAATLGVAGGIASYAGGRQLGVVAFDLTQPEALLSLVAVWGIGVPLLLHAAEVRNVMRAAIAYAGRAMREHDVAARPQAVHARRRVEIQAVRPGRMSSRRGMMSR